MPYGAVESLRCVHSAPKNANTGNEHACTAPRGLQPCPSSHGPAASESELNSALERNRNPASRRSLPRGELQRPPCEAPQFEGEPQPPLEANIEHPFHRASPALAFLLAARCVFTDVGLGTSLRCCAGRRCFSRWRVPLPAWELKRFCPPTPASAAVVPRAARCSRRAPPSQLRARQAAAARPDCPVRFAAAQVPCRVPCAAPTARLLDGAARSRLTWLRVHEQQGTRTRCCL